MGAEAPREATCTPHRVFGKLANVCIFGPNIRMFGPNIRILGNNAAFDTKNDQPSDTDKPSPPLWNETVTKKHPRRGYVPGLMLVLWPMDVWGLGFAARNLGFGVWGLDTFSNQ